MSCPTTGRRQVSVYRNLLVAAAANVARYRMRSFVVLLCLVAICAPYVTGVAISEGIRADAERSVEEGADLYLTMDHFGRNGPVPLKYLEALRASPYVLRVVPRIAGRAVASIGLPDRQTGQSELVVILGLEPEQFDAVPAPVRQAETPKMHQGDALIGAALADELQVQPGDKILIRIADVTMPFRIAGVLRRDAGIWSAQLICLTLEDAGQLFALPGYASEFLIYCRPGPGNIQAVREDMLDVLGRQPYRLQTKTREVRAYVDKGFRQQQGIFTVLYLVAFSVGIPALLVASGLGLSDRRREIGIAKAVGWQTTDVMLMVTFEQMLLSVMAASLAVLVSFVWLRVFNGAFVAQFFISEVGHIAPFRVPARFAPAAPALSLLLCLSITMVGGLYTTWRLATQPPAETMR